MTALPAPFDAAALDEAAFETSLIRVGGPLGVGWGVPSVAAVEGAAEPSWAGSSSARRSALLESSFSNCER